MARVGTISIDLVAHTGKLNAPLAKAATSVKSFVGTLQGTRAGFGSMLGGLAALTGGVLSFYAAFAKVKSQFSEIDEIAKSADRLGLTTEQFIGLQHGAELAGVETEQLTKSLQKLLSHKAVDISPQVRDTAAIQKMLDAQTFKVPARIDLRDAKKLQDLVSTGKVTIPANLVGNKDLNRLLSADTKKLSLKLDGAGSAQKAVKSVGDEVAKVAHATKTLSSPKPVALSADTTDAAKSISRFSSKLKSPDGVTVPVSFAKPDSMSLDAVKFPVVDINTDTSSAQKSIKTLSSDVQAARPKPLRIDADTTKVQKAIASVKAQAQSMVTVKVSDTSTAVDMVADTMASMSSDAERLRYSISVFGKDGAKMVDLLKGGAAGLREAQADAEKLGLTLNRVDAAKIEMANDAVSRLQAMVTGVARKIAIELAPFIKFAADQFVVLGTEGEGVGGKVRAGVDIVVAGIGVMLDAIDLVRTGWAGLQLVAQMSLSGMVTGIGYLVKGVELGTEAITNGFKFAWAQATQIVQEAVAGMIRLLSEVATWIESKLPERFQLGIGKAAQAFSDQFDAVVDQNRKSLDARSFNVDLKFGDDAMNFAKTLREDTARAAKDFNAFAGREKMSDKLQKNVAKIRDDAQKAAEQAAAVPEGDKAFTAADKVTAGALERGSQEAFSAFNKANRADKDPQEKQLAESRKQTEELKKLNKNGTVLKKASLTA